VNKWEMRTWPPMGSRFQEISVKEADTTACEGKEGVG
jgi:hypothetical protein